MKAKVRTQQPSAATATKGQCYDHYIFGDFLQFAAKNCVFLKKTSVVIQFLNQVK
jgi:hypothetical protein